MYGWRKRLNSSRMIFLGALMLASLAIPTSVRGGIIHLGELLEITEKMPHRGSLTSDGTIFGINSGTLWSNHPFQDDPAVPAISDDNQGLEVLGKDLIPLLDFSNVDQTDLKVLEIELRFSGSKK